MTKVWTYDEERAVIVRVRYRVEAEHEEAALERVQDVAGQFSVYDACRVEARRLGHELVGIETLGDSPDFNLVDVRPLDVRVSS